MSTYDLVMTAQPGGILALAHESQEFREHLEPFSGTEPLDLTYASLHTQWLHWSDIPVRSIRIQRDAHGVQTFYIDEGPWWHLGVHGARVAGALPRTRKNPFV